MNKSLILFEECINGQDISELATATGTDRKTRSQIFKKQIQLLQYLLAAGECCMNACGGTNKELAGRGICTGWGRSGGCIGGRGAWFGRANTLGYMLPLDTGALLYVELDAVAKCCGAVAVSAPAPATADGFGVAMPTQQKS